MDLRAYPLMPPPEVLARFPNGHYLENLLVAEDGSILFTDYFFKEIQAYRDGKTVRFAALPDFAVNLVASQEGYFALTHGVRFTEGFERLKGTNRLVWLSQEGERTRTLDLPKMTFGNGMAAMRKDEVLIADSVLGVIWRVSLQSGDMGPWLEDPRLKPTPGPRLALGANGLRVSADTAYVSNSSLRRVFRIAIDEHGTPEGRLETIAHLTGADDLAVGEDGGIYVATHGETVVHVSPEGDVETIADRDVSGCTSAALSKDGSVLYVLNTGGMFEGKKEDATLVRIPLGASRRKASLALAEMLLAFVA